MYADNMTGSMQRAISETERRRAIQDKYNKEHNIIPKTIVHNVKNSLEITKKAEDISSEKELRDALEKLTREMKKAAGELDFEKAIKLRDEVTRLRKQLDNYDKIKNLKAPLPTKKKQEK
jgi:Helicase subunit of the DNA excision repair complex